jgi:prolipoprotein diacylglyceryltransferase
VLINPFAGLSSFGGFLGAFLAFLYFTKKAAIDRLHYADSVALGLAVGWIFGRTGCFSAHDHPGRRVSASFFLSVNYPKVRASTSVSTSCCSRSCWRSSCSRTTGSRARAGGSSHSRR